MPAGVRQPRRQNCNGDRICRLRRSETPGYNRRPEPVAPARVARHRPDNTTLDLPAAPGLRKSRAPAMFKQLVSSICLIAALCEPGIASAAEDELPAGTRVLADIAYGPDPRQRFDVYIPPD